MVITAWMPSAASRIIAASTSAASVTPKAEKGSHSPPLSISARSPLANTAADRNSTSSPDMPGRRSRTWPYSAWPPARAPCWTSTTTHTTASAARLMTASAAHSGTTQCPAPTSTASTAGTFSADACIG